MKYEICPLGPPEGCRFCSIERTTVLSMVSQLGSKRKVSTTYTWGPFCNNDGKMFVSQMAHCPQGDIVNPEQPRVFIRNGRKVRLT